MNRANIVLLVRINSEKYISKFAKTLDWQKEGTGALNVGKGLAAGGMAGKGPVAGNRG